jgi:hypothetical protein
VIINVAFFTLFYKQICQTKRAIHVITTVDSTELQVNVSCCRSTELEIISVLVQLVSTLTLSQTITAFVTSLI